MTKVCGNDWPTRRKKNSSKCGEDQSGACNFLRASSNSSKCDEDQSGACIFLRASSNEDVKLLQLEFVHGWNSNGLWTEEVGSGLISKSGDFRNRRKDSTLAPGFKLPMEYCVL